MPKPVQITFDSLEAWEDNRENVDKKLQELTGADGFPSTRSLPPIIFGAVLDDDSIEQLREINGVIVQVSEDDD